MHFNLIETGFYKEQYDREQTRKNEIDNAIGLPSTLLTILIGGGLYLLKYSNIFSETHYLIYPNVFLLLFGILFILSICLSIIFLMKMYANNLMKYKYLPSASVLLKRESELYKHNYTFYKSIEALNPELDASNFSKNSFEEDILNYYVDFATRNQSINDKRLLDLYMARRFLILSIIFMGIFGFLTLII